MWNRINIKWPYKLMFVCLSIFFLIGLAEKKHNAKNVNQVVINIEQQYDNFFVDKGDINKLISNNNAINVMGIAMENIDLKGIEERIKTNKFVESADVYKDLKGSLIVNISQRRPIARVIRNTGPDGYISEKGVILPTSEKFTARVVLISGKNVDKLLIKDFEQINSEESILHVVQFIDNDPFWKAQIAQIELDDNNELILHPQVGKQEIIFGSPVDYQQKFKKLKVFFKQILPQKGWNKYEKVNIKYNNQIVCE